MPDDVRLDVVKVACHVRVSRQQHEDLRALREYWQSTVSSAQQEGEVQAEQKPGKWVADGLRHDPDPTDGSPEGGTGGQCGSPGTGAAPESSPTSPPPGTAHIDGLVAPE